jgi:lactoylglutathione lyase
MELAFSYTILYVSDVAETIQFYERAFNFSKKFISPEGDYGEMQTGNTTLSFAAHQLASSHFKEKYVAAAHNASPLGFELGFTTVDVEQALATALAAGATQISAVEEKPWGQKVVYIQDINGFLIEICTPMVG